MERHLDHDLDRIRQELLKMGGLVEQMVADATQALLDRNTPLARDVVVRDSDIDQLEIEIDEHCHSVLSRKQPTAVDLRFLVAVMKINSDLERIGDSAVNIAQSVQKLNEEPSFEPYVDIPHQSQLVQAMVRQSLDAFVRRDITLATDVCRADDDVDGVYRRLFCELLGYMTEDRVKVVRALHLLLISRNLERIADHSTNIAEDVIYYVSGRDIRHQASA
ncbi:MAG TPA: phosphate signaling complex protein PhoU [Thermoanaerobaculia bacterium]|nr:phosphate signaling complex protein PhoU [Thermoanaerobaculia bacterium]